MWMNAKAPAFSQSGVEIRPTEISGGYMNRRELLKAGVNAAAIASVLRSGRLLAQTPVTASGAGDTIYLNPATGADGNSGAKGSPLRTLGEAGRRVSQSAGTGPMTVVLSKGIYAVGESMLLKPQKRSFSAANRLTIRAEFLPDDPGWTADGMPTLIFTMPFYGSSDMERASGCRRRSG